MSYPGEVGTIYLLHFDRPFGSPDRYRRDRGRGPRKRNQRARVRDVGVAKHYIGWAADLSGRLAHHENGTGAELLRHVVAAGISWSVARLWAGTRDRERQLKNMGGASRLCPVCCGRTDGSEPEIDNISRARLIELGMLR